MKSHSLSVRRLLLLAGVTLLVGRPAPLRGQDAAGQAVMKLEAAWGAATMKRDGATVARMLAEDVTYIGPDGKIAGKADLVKGINGDTTTYVSGANLEMKPRVHGNTVVITGVWNVTKRRGTAARLERYLWTDTWVKGADGTWLCIAGQSMRLGK